MTAAVQPPPPQDRFYFSLADTKRGRVNYPSILNVRPCGGRGSRASLGGATFFFAMPSTRLAGLGYAVGIVDVRKERMKKESWVVVVEDGGGTSQCGYPALFLFLYA